MGRDFYEAFSDRWCCSCPKGYRKAANCGHGLPSTTVCKRCDFDPNDPNRQTFMDVENNSSECLKQSITEQDCLKKMNSRFVPGSHEQPNRCLCEDGYYSTFDAIMYGCNKHSSCDPGYYPEIVGDSTTDTKCLNCPSGTYSNVSSSTALCKKYSECLPGEIAFEGNSTHDVTCYKNFVTSETSPQTLDTYETATTTTQMIDYVKRNENFSAPAWLVVILLIGLAFALVTLAIVVLGKCLSAETEKSPHSTEEGLLPDRNTSYESISDDPEDLSESQREQFESEKYVDDESECSIKSSDEDESNFRVLTENGNTTLGSSRQDAALTSGKKINETMNKNVDGRSSKHRTEFRRSASSVQNVVKKLLKEKGEITVTYEDFPIPVEVIIQQLLNDAESGKKMMKCLQDYTLKKIRPFIRNFLNDTEIDNIKSDNRDDVAEIKYQLLVQACTKLGRTLTPSYILCDLDFEKGSCPADFFDSMLEVFAEEVGKKFRRSQNEPSAL